MTCKDIRLSLGIMSTDVSTLDWPKNEILSFLKFPQKKVSQLDKRIFCTESRGLATWFFKITTPELYKYVQDLLWQAGEHFSAESWKMSFLDQFNVETASCLGPKI